MTNATIERLKADVEEHALKEWKDMPEQVKYLRWQVEMFQNVWQSMDLPEIELICCFRSIYDHTLFRHVLKVVRSMSEFHMKIHDLRCVMLEIVDEYALEEAKKAHAE